MQEQQLIQFANYAVIATAFITLIGVGTLAFDVLPRLRRIIEELKKLNEKR